MFVLRRPPEPVVRRVLAAASDADFSYSEVGATAKDLPAGYRHDHWTAELGEDSPERFRRARDAVLGWVAQTGVGMSIYPDQPVSDGLTFVLTVPLPLFGHAVAPARVVYVVDEPDRVGFAYGTLPGHPEQGEEAFIVCRRDGRVHYEITAFSKPRHPVARLGGPASRAFQVATTRRYLAVMEAACQ